MLCPNVGQRPLAFLESLKWSEHIVPACCCSRTRSPLPSKNRARRSERTAKRLSGAARCPPQRETSHATALASALPRCGEGAVTAKLLRTMRLGTEGPEPATQHARSCFRCSYRFECVEGSKGRPSCTPPLTWSSRRCAQ
jgi:hypothetical protein